MGIQDFKEIREADYLYIDKSEMISQILLEGAKVYLYTRPRRFGKSVNLSMLDAFFNLGYPTDNKWFDGLKVSENEGCLVHKNRYPVIYFDFKELGVNDVETFHSDLTDEMCCLYSRYEYLRESDAISDPDKDFFNKVMRCEVNHIRLRKAISRLSHMLRKHHGRNVVMLFDEYDNPIHNAYGKPFLPYIIQTMKDILSSALKGNGSLRFGVVTGVMQVSKESIFSGLNNLSVKNILSRDFDEMFGFTDDEVRSILEEYGYPEKYDEAKDWYDGYRFGDADIYNPWSLLNYVKSGFVPDTYWAGTSGNSIIDIFFDIADDRMLNDLRSLALDVPVVKNINTTVTFSDLDNDVDNIYSIMVMSGYLKALRHDGGHVVALPNGEMSKVFGEVVASKISRTYGCRDTLVMVRGLLEAMVDNDIDRLEHSLYRIFADTLGSIMLDNERVYQTFLTALLMLSSGRYSVTAEFENGNGRYDIMLRSNSPMSPHVLIELKHSTDKACMQADAEKALAQIEDRDYAHGLGGRVVMFGIAFNGKMPKVVSRIRER